MHSGAAGHLKNALVRPGTTLGNRDLRPGLLRAGIRVADAHTGDHSSSADTECHALQQSAAVAVTRSRLAKALLRQPGLDARLHRSVDAINECSDHGVAVLGPEFALDLGCRSDILRVHRRGTHGGRITRQCAG